MTAPDQIVIDRVRRNPTLHPDALSDEEFATIPWHSHAASERSSQVFAISAFGPLRRNRCRDHVIADLVSASFPSAKTVARPRRWDVLLESQCPELLSEYGSKQPTQIDVLLKSSAAVIAIESKFLTDAREGFGGCGQYTSGKCEGYHGVGSDKTTRSAAWCRLEHWDGIRSPRTYWAFGKSFFRPDVMREQAPGDLCPFKGANYQLMRNFLFAAALAMREGKPQFGVLAISPEKTQGVLSDQITRFRERIVTPAYADCVQLTTYEAYSRILRTNGEAEALALASFLDERLAKFTGPF